MKTVISVVAAVVIAVLLVAGVVLFVGLDWGAQKAQKEAKAAAAAAMQAMSFTQELHERLGTPFTQGEVSVQSADIQVLGTSTMQLSVSVSGPKGGGKASCSLARPQGGKGWSLTSGTFFPTSGPPVPVKTRPASGGPGIR